MLCSWRSLPFAIIEDMEGFDEGGEERVEQVSEDKVDEMEVPEKD